MEEYILSATAETTVEAENQEEAKEAIWEHQRDLDYNQIVAEPLTSDKDYFKLHLRTVGSNKRNFGYGLMQSQSALGLAFRGSTSICRSLLGPDMATQLRYNLALHLLATVEGDSIEGETLEENIQEIKEKAHELSEDDVESPFTEVASQDFVIEPDDEEEADAE